LFPSARHHIEKHANNPRETDHGQLKHRLRPTRGLPTDQTAQAVIASHTFVQNLRRGHYRSRNATEPGDQPMMSRSAGCRPGPSTYHEAPTSMTHVPHAPHQRVPVDPALVRSGYGPVAQGIEHRSPDM
jgi:hypothetical protein